MSLKDIHEQAGASGFVTTENVAEADVASTSFTRHASTIGWTPRFWRVWVPPGLVLQHTQLCAAAVASMEGDVMVTGASALFTLGVVADPPHTVELLLPSRRHVAKRNDVCLHRSTTFDGVRGTNRDGLLLAATARALADHAAHASNNELCRDISTALRMRLCTLNALAGELTARKRFPGRAGLRLAIASLAGETVHSGGERRARRLLGDEGFTPFPRPFPVESAGRVIAEIDIAFPDLRYGIEIDGPHHLLPNVAAADRARDRSLEALGWAIDRFYWFEVEERPSFVVAQVQKRMSQLGA